MKKILVCEDESAIRDFVVINLTRAGYDVVEADCGEAALKKYEENDGDFDIAILDVMMPGIDGFQVCKELRNRNGGIGIIMLSAKTQEMDKVTGLMLGADDYVAKPFSPSELLARVDACGLPLPPCGAGAVALRKQLQGGAEIRRLHPQPAQPRTDEGRQDD